MTGHTINFLEWNSSLHMIGMTAYVLGKPPLPGQSYESNEGEHDALGNQKSNNNSSDKEIIRALTIFPSADRE